MSGARRPVKDVIVVGAGIGGLTVAHALRRVGVPSVRVLERAPSFSPTAGAGFGFSPNGQACLASIGIQTHDILHPLRFHEMRGAGSKVVANSTHLDLILQKYGLGVAGTLRAQLVERLAEPLKAEGALLYNTNVRRVEQEGDVVHVESVGGEGGQVEVMEADLVIGADGINSLVANDVLKVKDEPVYSGEAIYYGVMDAPDPSKPWPFKDPILAQPHTLLQVLDRGEFIAFPVGGPVNGKPYTNIVWAITHHTAHPPKRDEWETGGTRAGLKKMLDARYKKDFVAYEALEVSGSLLQATEDGRLMHFGMSYRKPVTPTWSKGRVTLLGDACHATLPYVGQGANQAIEDAVVLAQCLKEVQLTDVDKALATYHERRFERTKTIVDTAWYLGKIMHVESPLASACRDLFFAALIRTGAFIKMGEEEIIVKCPVPIKPKNHQ